MWLNNTIKRYSAQRDLTKDNHYSQGGLRKGSRCQITCSSVMQKSYAMPLRINAEVIYILKMH
jgi:hypothetical protein